MINKEPVLIVDDHPLVLDSLAEMVDSSDQFRVVGKAKNGNEALDLVHKENFNLAILDVNLSEMSGLDLTRKIKKINPNIKILIFTMHEDSETTRQSKAAGASGYLTKNSDPLKVIGALELLVKGQEYFPEGIDLVSDDESNLTPRELEVLRFLARGLSSKEISNELNISPRTVEVHRGHLLKKFKAKNVVELITNAREKKWI